MLDFKIGKGAEVGHRHLGLLQGPTSRTVRIAYVSAEAYVVYACVCSACSEKIAGKRNALQQLALRQHAKHPTTVLMR